MAGKHALIGGGTGFIGTRLLYHLSNSGYEVTVVSRMPGARRITWHELENKGLPKTVTAVVNLAGQNVLDPMRRWTPGFKQNIVNSRVNSAAAMVRAILAAKHEVNAFVNISGVSHYKPSFKFYTEDDKVEEFEFMSKLCRQWETAATIPSNNCKCRNIKIRTGVVIGKGGGMIQSLKLPFMLGLGGPVGNGLQILPWIHIDDICRLIIFCIENNVNGVFNGVAPEIITNKEFAKAFASSLRRPAIFPLPEFVVNMIFGKERATLLLTGAKIKPKRTLDAGFEFKYPTIREACDEVTGRKR